MGGIGFIEANKAVIVHDNTLINMHMLEAARRNGASRFLYTSSACIYPGYMQGSPDVTPLKEEDAYPADAEDGYGWEKLMAERLCRHYHEDYGLATCSVRFHNIFGPLGTYDGGREKSPAAICRKVALAADGDEIEVWGDGQQTRSYCYIDDCVEGIYRLMRSDHREPINLGQDRMVTVNELVDIVATVAGKTIKKRHDLTKPQGVRGRNADLTLMRVSARLGTAGQLGAGPGGHLLVDQGAAGSHRGGGPLRIHPSPKSSGAPPLEPQYGCCIVLPGYPVDGRMAGDRTPNSRCLAVVTD